MLELIFDDRLGTLFIGEINTFGIHPEMLVTARIHYPPIFLHPYP